MPSIKSLLQTIGGGALLSQTPFSNKSPYSDSSSSINLNSGWSSPPPASFLTQSKSCPANGPLSCHNTTSSEDSCCFIHPGGELLLTQFWDTRPSIGPRDSWTLHGLWPDLCDGTYEQFCRKPDSPPMQHNITDILVSHNQTELLDTMLKYWLPNRGTPENFWLHEWNKHGTCVNTLSPSCYSPPASVGAETVVELKKRGEEGYTPGLEVIEYFARAVSLFEELDTYQALAEANIYPSYTRRYSAQQLQQALRSVTGRNVVLGCSRGSFNQAWYTFNVRGSLQTGEFVPAEPAGSGKGTCPRTGIRYWPKS